MWLPGLIVGIVMTGETIDKVERLIVDGESWQMAKTPGYGLADEDNYRECREMMKEMGEWRR